MNIVDIYKNLKQILKDSNEALIEKGLSEVNSLWDVSAEINKLGEINRLPYIFRKEIIEVNSEDFGDIPIKIKNYVFNECTSLASVTIGNNVTGIGQSAFRFCTNLTSVTIPNSVTSIGDYAFYCCTSLANVTIPDNVTSIGNYAFESCYSLENVTIGNSVTSIGQSAFSNCYNLANITIGNSITSIGYSAFRYCYNIENIYLYQTIPPTIDDSSFVSSSNIIIHVPIGSGEAYKSATNWSYYADRIVEDIVV